MNDDRATPFADSLQGFSIRFRATGGPIGADQELKARAILAHISNLLEGVERSQPILMHQQQQDVIRSALDAAGLQDVKAVQSDSGWAIAVPTTGTEKYPEAATGSFEFYSWPNHPPISALAEMFKQNVSDMRLYMAGTHPDQINEAEGV